MADTYDGKSTNWFTAGNGLGNNKNWSNGVPAASAAGTLSVTVGSFTTQPVITEGSAPTADDVAITQAGGAGLYTEYQLAGEQITLTAGAALTLQGAELGVYAGATYGKAVTNLTAAGSTTATFDSHAVIETSGAGIHTLNINDVDHNFGLIDVASGTLSIATASGGNNQTEHGLYNYGLISVASGAELEISTVATTGDTVGFYNPGWIEVEGGTLDASAAILDGANKPNTTGTPDGYIEIGNAGDVILSGGAAVQEEVDFTDATANTLQITAGTLFGGTVANFGPSDTIMVTGYTGSTNATLVPGTTSGTSYLETTNGTVTTTITLTGSVSPEITTRLDTATGQEVIEAGATIFNSGSSTLGSLGGTVANTLAITVTGSGTELTLNDSVSGTGSYFIDYGATLAMDNTTGNDAGQSVTFGTHGSATALNTFIINDNTADFGGSITGFGINDVIDLGASVLPAPAAGDGIALSYTNGVLTVSETNAAGAVVGTDTTNLTLAGTAALSTASFVALDGPAGIEIETAAQLSGSTFTFNDALGTHNFATPGNFAGGIAPGNVIAPGEFVTIAAGTAIVSNGAITDNGTINVGTTFSDASTITGTGTIAVQAGAHATLTGGASLTGGITDAGTLTLGGAFTGPISLTTAAAAITVSGTFADASAITGLGTLTVGTLTTATLAGGTTLGAINDFGTIDLTGSTSVSSINMEGNGADSVVDFSATNSATALTNFGTGDIITSAYGTLPAGDGVAFSYSGDTLTVTETSASGTSLGSAIVTVSGVPGATLSSASFVALYGANGVDVELAGSPAATNFTFTGAAGTSSFETPGNFSGGFAPGNFIAPSETVTILTNTASVASGPVTDNGKISVTSVFIDTGSLTGTGSLSILAGGQASLTGGASLASIIDAGTLVAAGSFAAPISLGTGAQLTLSGNFTDTDAITGPGTLTVDSGVTATLAAGSSLSAIYNYGTLDVLGSLATPINMEGNGAHSVADFSGTDVTAQMLDTSLIDFGKGDQIILGSSDFSLTGTSDSFATPVYNATTGQLVIDDLTSGTVVTLNVGMATSIATPVTGANFSLSIGANGLDISVPCYASGTRILTQSGDVLVEDLAVGDTVVTVRDGGPATRKIVWTGQRSIDIARHPHPELVLPVRILAGAFGPGVPERDLRLSPHHAVFANGCLFEAVSLVNGVTIIQEQNTRSVTYHHIELEEHDVMLAEGLPAESFLDTGNRDMFAHASAPIPLHADFRPLHDEGFCAPMVREGAALETIRAELQDRADRVVPQVAAA
jgi:hypothetical protein